MAITITIEEIRERYNITISDEALTDIIAVVNTIVPCLEANYQEAIGKLIAYSLTAHMAEMQSGRRVKSQSAANGASQSFELGREGEGLSSTTYGQMVKQLDTNGCTDPITGESSTAGFLVSLGSRNSPT